MSETPYIADDPHAEAQDLLTATSLLDEARACTDPAKRAVLIRAATGIMDQLDQEQAEAERHEQICDETGLTSMKDLQMALRVADLIRKQKESETPPPVAY